MVEAGGFSLLNSIEDEDHNTAALVESALANPIDFPRLSETVFPGDRVAIVVQPELPDLEVILDRLVQELIDHQVEPPDVTLVVTAGTAKTLGIPEITSTLESADEDERVYPVLDSFHSVQCHVHRPSDEKELCYLAANRDALPLMVSRPIAEADVVLPVGFPMARKGSVDTIAMVDPSIYPTFSSQETIERFRNSEKQEELEAETRLVNDHLGVFSAIQVVPGIGEEIKTVLCGERKRVAELAQTEFMNSWSIEGASGECDLLIATIDGNADEQSWDDVVQAVALGSELAPTAKQFIIWSELTEKPNRDIKSACRAQFESDERKKNSKLSRSLRRFADVVGRQGVFLHSRLGQTEVESLGLGHVGPAGDLQRMIGDAKCGVFIANAHRCLLTSHSNERSPATGEA